MSDRDRMPEGEPRTVVVLGLGLMGGSLCRALKAAQPETRVVGVDPDAVEGARALEAGAVDAFEIDGLAAVSDADVIVYAAPLRVTTRLLTEQASQWREGALVTDVVSLKAPVLRAAGRAGVGSRMVGAHPICGGERSGFAAGNAALYRDATIWLCAAEGVSPGLRERAEAFWTGVGGIPRWEEAEEHDRRMAWLSHLPQLVSNALAGALDAAGCDPAELGPGGRDMTRLAGSNPKIWRDLLEASAPVTGTGLTSVSNALNILADLLARRELDRITEFMERTREWRRGDER